MFNKLYKIEMTIYFFYFLPINWSRINLNYNACESNHQTPSMSRLNFRFFTGKLLEKLLKSWFNLLRLLLVDWFVWYFVAFCLIAVFPRLIFFSKYFIDNFYISNGNFAQWMIHVLNYFEYWLQLNRLLHYWTSPLYFFQFFPLFVVFLI